MKTKIILEMGCNHQGEIAIAKRMIDDAKNLNVWAVKFQKRDIESIPDELKTTNRNIKNSFGMTYYEHRKNLEFDNRQIKLLMDYSKLKGLEFICSAFDENSIINLYNIGCENIKIPSQLITNENIQKELKKYKFKNIIGSTGMHDFTELNQEYMDIYNIIFHCISVYPARLIDTNLIRIRKLISNFPEKIIGYSSHEINGDIIHYAVLCGAKIIECHYTLDKKMKGSDHGTVSRTFMEIAKIKQRIQYIETILGEIDYKIEKEEKNRSFYRCKKD